MFVSITNQPQPYAWGSRTGISGVLGRPAAAGPEAELWLGDHPSCPARIVHPDQLGGHTTLDSWVRAEPARALGSAEGEAGRLPFLLKLLAADAPLSLQAHPSKAQAHAGYLRESALGIPLDAGHRNYKDRNHKPELIVALSERFEALCGFRPLEESRRVVVGLRTLAARSGQEPAALLLLEKLLTFAGTPADALEWLLGGSEEVRELVIWLTDLAEDASVTSVTPPALTGELELVRRLGALYPGDPGVLVALLLHHVSLTRGEALYLPAGNIHAYLGGVGVELMAASDNVLRGGLTSKHVDVPELLSVLNFDTGEAPLLHPRSISPGVAEFRPDVPDFRLLHIQPAADGSRVVLSGPAIVLAVDGETTLRGAVSAAVIGKGESLYITPDEGDLLIEGSGELHLATVGGPATDRAVDPVMVVAERGPALQDGIERAVEQVKDAILRGRAHSGEGTGILVTRLEDTLACVEPDQDVPFGVTRERDLRMCRT